MDIQSLEGKTVRITLSGLELQDPYIRPKIGSGEETITIVTLIESVDDLGLWIRVSDFPVFDGTSRKKEMQSALILLRYDFVTSVVHFPDIAEDSSKSHKIGFMADDEFLG